MYQDFFKNVPCFRRFNNAENEIVIDLPACRFIMHRMRKEKSGDDRNAFGRKEGG